MIGNREVPALSVKLGGGQITSRSNMTTATLTPACQNVRPMTQVLWNLHKKGVCILINSHILRVHLNIYACKDLASNPSLKRSLLPADIMSLS